MPLLKGALAEGTDPPGPALELFREIDAAEAASVESRMPRVT
nr:hypothetical protein [uncultured Actinoplanes sp.]